MDIWVRSFQSEGRADVRPQCRTLVCSEDSKEARRPVWQAVEGKTDRRECERGEVIHVLVDQEITLDSERHEIKGKVQHPLCTISSSDLGFLLTFILVVHNRWEPGPGLLTSFVQRTRQGSTACQHYSFKYIFIGSSYKSLGLFPSAIVDTFICMGWGRMAGCGLLPARKAPILAAATAHEAQECSSHCKHTLKRDITQRSQGLYFSTYLFFF